MIHRPYGGFYAGTQSSFIKDMFDMYFYRGLCDIELICNHFVTETLRDHLDNLQLSGGQNCLRYHQCSACAWFVPISMPDLD